jgi:hypothetical protein
MASGLLPKSPVSSSLCDEVPHIFIPKSHLEPREFLISSAKRLLQQYRYKADVPIDLPHVRYRGDCVAKVGEEQVAGNNRIGAGNFLNQYCALLADLESILLAQVLKIFLQQYRG